MGRTTACLTRTGTLLEDVFYDGVIQHLSGCLRWSNDREDQREGTDFVLTYGRWIHRIDVQMNHDKFGVVGVGEDISLGHVPFSLGIRLCNANVVFPAPVIVLRIRQNLTEDALEQMGSNISEEDVQDLLDMLHRLDPNGRA